MSTITFADVVHQSISFSRGIDAHAVVLDLVDTGWFQRLRDISQTANTRLVYMFSEHSRFGHSLGVAYLANMLMDKLSLLYPKEIGEYRTAVSAAALLHDIGHLAPGSHTAYKTWFPDKPDEHEHIALRIIDSDEEVRKVLLHYGAGLPELVKKVLEESDELPPWSWEIISGGGWNVDRGNWCIADSIMAGVSYGKYNIPALTESMVLTGDKHLALNESRLDAMMHFALSRHAMYRQIYQHRVLLAADMINMAVVQRARDLQGALPFADEHMLAALKAETPADLSLANIYAMRESWWKYHLSRWIEGKDTILADLSSRLLDRRLFKTIRVRDVDGAQELYKEAKKAVQKAGFDPRYYLHKIETVDTQESDYRQSMLVVMDDGRIRHLTDAEPLFNAMVKASKSSLKSWIAVPNEAKAMLGRPR